MLARHLLTSALCLLPLAALAGESVVTIPSDGGDIVGTLSLPDGAEAPVVLLLHGFTGTRDELATEHVEEGVFAFTAARLAEAGLASLRIDFRGSGDSLADLVFAETTFETQIADAVAAAEWLANAAEVKGDNLHVIGWSQGGLVAAAFAGRSSVVQSLTLWNAVGDPETTFTGILGEDVMAAGRKAAADEPVTTTLPWGVEISLNGAFFDGIDTHDAVGEVSEYLGPLMIVQGDADTTVLPENADAYAAAHTGETTVWRADMDHVFNVFGSSDALAEMVAATIAFIEEVQG